MVTLAISIIKILAFSIIFFAIGYYFIFKRDLPRATRYSLLAGVILLLVEVIIPILIVYYVRSPYAH